VKGSQVFFSPWRFYFVLSLIFLTVIGLIARSINLAILNQHFLMKQGDERVLRLVRTPAFRGMIVDRNGFPLAISTTVYSVWINPKEFAPQKNMLLSLSNVLKLPPKEITAIVKHYQNSKRGFVYLKRGLSPQMAKYIQSLHIAGLHTQQEYRRYYPEGEIASQVVGFTNIDDQGQEGLELAYNQWLTGESGKKWVIKDRLGRAIADVHTLQEQKAGRDLVLSMDRRIQYLAYRELMAGVIKNQAASGSIVVLDSRTGEVLAMANYPSFNANNRNASHKENFRNRAVTDSFEPGSTIKAFSIASALDSGKFKADSVIDTSPGWMRVEHSPIPVRDEHNNGLLSLMQILQVSSNVGTAKIILSLPPDHLWNVLHRVGFGEITGIGFPGEQNGSLVKHAPWGAFTLATLAFGYGMSVTPLQLARAYSVIANDGVKLPVSLLKLDTPPPGDQVMEAKVTKQMLLLLESVVSTKGATGELARVPGYRIAGKTGTSKIALEHGRGYEKHRYFSSFVGIAPVTNPRLIVAVVIRDPHGKQYLGGSVSGPVFEKVMENTLRILSVPPDGEVVG
jgi:cell division protein FtsI (penicillin-binding protein 3)